MARAPVFGHVFRHVFGHVFRHSETCAAHAAVLARARTYVCACVRLHAFIGACRNSLLASLCLDMRLDMHSDMRVDMRLHMFFCMCLGMCSQTQAAARMSVCHATPTTRPKIGHLKKNVNTNACKDVETHVRTHVS